jgi:uncharacterized protein (DUF433 family)
VLEGYCRLDWSEARILVSYPTLCGPDLATAWAFVDANRAEIDEAIRVNETA